jgi:hypothetical protein
MYNALEENAPAEGGNEVLLITPKVTEVETLIEFWRPAAESAPKCFSFTYCNVPVEGTLVYDLHFFNYKSNIFFFGLVLGLLVIKAYYSVHTLRTEIIN